MKAARDLVCIVPGALAEAERIAGLRTAVVGASIEYVLAERLAREARSRFAFASDANPRIDEIALSRIAGTYVDAAKREQIAKERWQHATRELVAALERWGQT